MFAFANPGMQNSLSFRSRVEPETHRDKEAFELLTNTEKQPLLANSTAPICTGATISHFARGQGV